MSTFTEQQFSQTYRDQLTVLVEMSLEELDGEEVLNALESKGKDEHFDTGVSDRVDDMYFEQTDRHLEGEELEQFITMLKAIIEAESQ